MGKLSSSTKATALHMFREAGHDIRISDICLFFCLLTTLPLERFQKQELQVKSGSAGKCTDIILMPCFSDSPLYYYMALRALKVKVFAAEMRLRRIKMSASKLLITS